jgi:hypothetical protein
MVDLHITFGHPNCFKEYCNDLPNVYVFARFDEIKIHQMDLTWVVPTAAVPGLSTVFLSGETVLIV